MKFKTKSDVVLETISYIFMGLFSIFCLIPFILVITNSIVPEADLAANGFTLIPKRISFDAYKVVFKGDVVLNAYKVTIFITVVGTIMSMLFTSLMAYPLSVKNLKYRNNIAMYVYITMLFSGGLVPTYILITRYLHLDNTIWVYIIPSLINPWNLFVLRNFFGTIPDSLAESARIDGASEVYILWKIILPLSKPAIATLSLFYALGYWNEWFKSVLYITDQKLYTLQYLIMAIMRDIQMLTQYAQEMNLPVNYILPQQTVRMATTVVTIGPIIFLYPFLQKYFVKGLVIGAVKG